ENRKTYDRLFKSGESLSKIRDAALTDRLFPNFDDIEVPGRSIAWKLLLLPDEPLTTTPTHPQPLLASLRSSRKRYAEDLSEKMRAPDGSYGDGFIPRDPSYTTRRETVKATNLEHNNPLSLHTDNPWTEWFAAVELRKTIFQDVERTFPEIDFFRQPEVQDQLTNILFLYSTTHTAIGYRQGMHELLAPLYFALDFDCTVGHSIEDPVGREICSKTWVAADAWVIFECIMKSVSTWYEWRAAPETTPNLPSPLSHHVNMDVQSGPVEIKPYVAPIVQACNRIQSVLLKSVDPVLWKHIQSTGIEPQIYGIRWLRLLFTREFGLPDALKLWDGLFACDPTFGLVPWICVAMLIRIRNQLIPADYTGQLSVLLKYPAAPTSGEPGFGHHTSLLIRQALALQMSPNPSTGLSLVTENRNLLGIPIEVPEPAPAPRRRAAQTISDKSSPRRSSEHTRQASSPQLGFPEMFARGIVERGESLGINKTLMSAVSELRRNIPELAASFMRTPTPNSDSVFPLADETSPVERPPWEPKSRLQIEREIGQIQTTNKLLGESLTWVVDALLQDESEATNPTQLKRRKQEALETLSYMRDILNGSVNGIDQERLFTEEENAKRKSHSAQLQSESSFRTTSMGYFDKHVHTPKAPVPAPVVDSNSKVASPKPRSSALPAQKPQYPVSPSPASSPEASIGGGLRLAPWNYTQSGFGSSSTLPSTSLPRLPPRTSSSIHRQTPAAATSVPKAPVREDKPEARVTPDPLGVLS
ncbi:RabGAP/TBC, partial [Marasmius fiardii PR-910]